MRFFFDTSALAKRYVAEPGSDEVDRILSRAGTVAVSLLVVVELRSALVRLRRSAAMSEAAYLGVSKRFERDLRDMELVALNGDVVVSAARYVQRHLLRSLDALQVACGVASFPDLFVTADGRQAAAARAEGLTVAVVG